MRRIAALAALLVAWSATADAAWPERPIRVIVPFAPGGTSDQIARVFQRAIEEESLLSQPLSIVNIGGHYSVGGRQAKDAQADGYTFLVMHVALMGGEASGAVDFGHRAFAPVASTSEFCLVPSVREDSPYRDARELLEAAKAAPDSILLGVNIGAINHMAALLMQEAVPGARFRFVQVGGGAENFKQLAGGHTQAAVFSSAEYLSFKDSGLRGLGWTGPTRNERLPELALLKDQGIDVEFCVANWWFAPAGTPQEAIDGLASALEAAMATPYVRQELDNKLLEPVFLTGEPLEASLAETYARVAPIAKLAAPTKQ